MASRNRDWATEEIETTSKPTVSNLSGGASPRWAPGPHDSGRRGYAGSQSGAACLLHCWTCERGTAEPMKSRQERHCSSGLHLLQPSAEGR